MKQFFAIGLSICVFLSSCSSQQEEPRKVMSKLSFNIEQVSFSDGKAAFVPTWSEGEQVSVFCETAPKRNQKFIVAGPEGGEQQLRGNTFAGDSYCAVYPFDEKNVWSGGKVTAFIPSEQRAASGRVPAGSAAAIARSDDGHLQFMNLAALLVFSLPDRGYGDMTSVRLKGQRGEALAGWMQADVSGSELDVVPAGGSAAEIHLNGQMHQGETYSIVLAPVNCEDGIALEFEGGNGYHYTFHTGSRLDAEPGEMIVLGELDLKVQDSGYPGKTAIGRKVAEGTGLMGKFLSDYSWTVTSGLTATQLAYETPDGLPVRCFVYEVDLTDPHVTISQTTPLNQPVGAALQTVTRQALACDAPDFKIWGGTNSDFFDMKYGTNLPHGICHHKGEVQKDFFNPKIKRKMSFFYIDKEKTARIGLEKDYAQVASTGVMVEAFGGGELLVDKGKVCDNPQPLEPRTCIGLSADGKRVIILVVDGRNPAYSNGMTLNELAEFMQAAGAHTAINLDGGGSSTFFVRNPQKSDTDDTRFEVLNQPSDGRERGVANGLVIVSES